MGEAMARRTRYISDTDVLSQITPWTLRNYLAAQGWREVEPYGDVGYVYAQDEISDEIIIPSRQDFSDYALAVNRIILALAETEERDELAIARDLSLAHFDSIRVRIQEDTGDGSVSLDSGVALMKQARDMLLSAACSTKRPRRSFRLGSNRAANDYIQKVRLGQTERGSFVVNLLSPIVPRLPAYATTTVLSQTPEYDTFERRVTQKLSTGLQIVHEETRIAHAEAGRFARIPEEGIERYGVSANLCEAVGELIDVGNGSGVDISISWAMAYPSNESRVQVRFDSEDAPVLKEAANMLRRQRRRPDTGIRGFVSSLTRESYERKGRASIKAKIGDAERAVRVDFSSGDYDRIVNAHRRRRIVSVKGDLWFDGHRWSLTDPHDVEVVRR